MNLKSLNYPDNEAISQAIYVYDAVWMVAFAFNKSIAVLAEKNQTLADFTYDNSEMRQIFIDQLSKLNFRGVSVSLCIYCSGYSL